jgi:endonuclease YncB( thermonuclease family)
MRAPAALLGAAVVLMAATTARADPCKAIPDNGPVPAFLAPGKTFSGPVVRVLDGDSLCVAVGPGPASWVEVRLVDFYAPESSEPGGPAAKAALERIALGKQANCRAGPQSYDRVVSSCTIDGRSIGGMMRAAGILEGGRGFGRAPAAAPRRRFAETIPSVEPADAPRPFRNCAEARAAGAAPVYQGQPGYAPWLDRDGDGIGCEPYRRR